MKKYKITLVKDYEEHGKHFDKGLSQGFDFRTICWFNTKESFSHQSTDRQKRVLRKKLKMMSRDSLPFDVNDAKVGEKERIIISEKGRYEIDEAVYDSQTKIPEHLRASKKVRRKS